MNVKNMTGLTEKQLRTILFFSVGNFQVAVYVNEFYIKNNLNVQVITPLTLNKENVSI